MGISIAVLMEKKAALEAELAEHGKDALKEEFRKFFDANPECKVLRWEQYTPYFNDGSPCEFIRDGFSLKMNDTPEDENDEDEDAGFEWMPYGDRRAYDLPRNAAYVAAVAGARKLETIDAEIYKIVFSDGVRVTATRDGFEVEEYDHD